MRKRLRVWADLRVRMMGLAMLAAPLAALCALTLSVRTLQSERRQAEERLYRTVQLHRDVQELQSDLLGAGTALCAYLLQGQEEVLSPFKAARDSLPERLAGLDKLLQTDPIQAPRVKRLRPLVDRYIDILSSLRKYSAIPGFSPANPPDDLMREQTGVTNQIQKLLAELEQEEDQRTQLAYGEAHGAHKRSETVVLCTLAFGLLGGLIVVWLLMSSLITSERSRAEKEVKESHEQLQQMLQKAEAQAKALAASEQEAERTTRAKSEFLSRMSHELRTPLNAILGFAQLLEMADLKTLYLDHVAQILKAGRHLLALINEVLDISRIESGRLALSLEPVLIGELLREALIMVQPQAASAKVIISADSALSDPRLVIADRQRLKQVMLNLFSNAVKYNRIGGSVRIEVQAAERNRIRIRVNDTGVGIPAEKMKLLFSPFERLGAEQTDVEGTGIGLVLSKRLVEIMEGRIGVESEVNVGTTFWIELPGAVSPEDSLKPEFTGGLMAAADAVSEVERPTVICIEDNPSNLRLIERIMAQRPGIRLLTALMGQTGLDLARQCHPRLILLDVHLPDIDGKEVLQRLRADPNTSGIPVVVISADATPHQEKRLRDAGAQDYLTKPLDVPKFLEIVDRTLEHARTT